MSSETLKTHTPSNKVSSYSNKVTAPDCTIHYEPGVFFLTTTGYHVYFPGDGYTSVCKCTQNTNSNALEVQSLLTVCYYKIKQQSSYFLFHKAKVRA